jgi:hypothetical protein
MPPLEVIDVVLLRALGLQNGPGGSQALDLAEEPFDIQDSYRRLEEPCSGSYDSLQEPVGVITSTHLGEGAVDDADSVLRCGASSSAGIRSAA